MTHTTRNVTQTSLRIVVLAFAAGCGRSHAPVAEEPQIYVADWANHRVGIRSAVACAGLFEVHSRHGRVGRL